MKRESNIIIEPSATIVDKLFSISISTSCAKELIENVDF